jgi:S1-C subfamily serine protease
MRGPADARAGPGPRQGGAAQFRPDPDQARPAAPPHAPREDRPALAQEIPARPPLAAPGGDMPDPAAGARPRLLPPADSPAETDPPAETGGDEPITRPAAPAVLPSGESILEGVKPAIAYFEGKRGSGTAFVVRPGILATNNHILQDEYIDNLRVRFVSADDPTARGLPVKLLYRDRARDLALVAVDSDRKALRLADVKDIRRGNPVAVIGHPSRYGGVLQELHAVTVGTIEGLVMHDRKPWYHLKADAAPGNSGGPVIDRRTGEVVGVLTFGLREQAEATRGRFGPRRPGVPPPRRAPQDTFCIPVAFVREAIAEVEAAGDRNRLSRVVTARYAAEMVTLQICVVQRISARVAPRRIQLHLRRGNDQDAQLVASYLDLHEDLMEALKPAIQHVQATPDLPASTKKTVGQLLQNYDEMKRMVEKPRTRVADAYTKKYNALARTHEKYVKALFKELSIPDRVEVQLLD